jgi:hypothetical protein
MSHKDIHTLIRELTYSLPEALGCPDMVEIDLPEWGPPKITPDPDGPPDVFRFKISMKPTGRIVRCMIPRKVLEKSLLVAKTVSIVEALREEAKKAIDVQAKALEHSLTSKLAKVLEKEEEK